MSIANNPNAVRILEERYLMPGETPEDMFRRVSRVAAKNNKGMDELFYQMMWQGRFLPNSPTLMNAGTENGQSWSACFVLPIDDTITNGKTGIHDILTAQAVIQRAGGGTGFSFSRIRPEGDPVNSTNGVASGPVSFLKLYDANTEQIKQGGKRRGANMAVLSVHHPDIRKFITCKLDGGIQNFNISVGITDEFMSAVKSDETYELRFNGVREQVKAREIWDLICETAWKTGDPGLVFLDIVNRSTSAWDPTKEIEACNPCGEQYLYPWGSCNLGSVNLSMYVEGNSFNVSMMANDVKAAVVFLDSLIDDNPFPIQEITDMARGERRIGLGIMGWHHALMKMGIPYDSQEAISLIDHIGLAFSNAAHEESEILGKEYGIFPFWNGGARVPKRRNANVTTIAPTGTISIIAGCSSGIEPIFAREYTHNNQRGRVLQFTDPVYEAYKDQYPPEVFKTALEISPEWHIRHQASWQQYIDNSISKTVNLPNSARVEDVEKAYMQAHASGCKGVTIYRDGSRDVQVLNAKDSKKGERPPVLSGRTVKRTMGFNGKASTIYITVNEYDGVPYEVFINTPKANDLTTEQIRNLTARLVSWLLRAGVPCERVVKELRQTESVGVNSFPTIIASVLEQLYEKSEDECPSCGAPLVIEEGCIHCSACSYSRC